MRIVTRGDLDGLTSSVLLSEMLKITEIALVHPQDITNKKVAIDKNDVLANLPFHPECTAWFDHHEHTDLPAGKFQGRYDPKAPSCARVVYDFYKSPKLARFDELVRDTDRYDSAALTRDDVMDPKGAILIGFLIDPRTGMGGDYRAFFRTLVDELKAKSPDEVLSTPEMREMRQKYIDNTKRFQDLLLQHSEVDGNIVITDFRKLERPPVGNRFVIYTMFPHCNVSVRLQWGPGRKFVAVNIGHSIFDRTCRADVGAICREFGGGGHRGAGACTLSASTADLEIHDIVERLIENS